MEQLKKAFEDAKLYDKYVYSKMYGQGNILWGYLGFVGSLLSYFILVISNAIDIDPDFAGAGIGMLWLGIVSFGLLFAFNIRPEEMSNMTKKPKESTFLWIAWPVGFAFGAIGEGLAWQLEWVNTPAIFAVTVGLIFGNLANFVELKQKMTLTAPILMFGTLFGIILVPYPYEMLIFGIGAWLPYYIIGFKIYKIDLPKMLKG